MSNLHKSLVAIQSELKAPKNQYNSFGKYKYRSCEDILEAVKPLLQKYGLCLVLSDSVVVLGQDGHARFYVKATATLSDDTGILEVSAFARESLAKKGMDESQITGTSSSYARKYALNGLFLIDDTKDDDTREPSDVTEKNPLKQTTSKKAKDALSSACAKYAKFTGSTVEEVKKGVMARHDYTASDEWYLMVAGELIAESGNE